MSIWHLHSPGSSAVAHDAAAASRDARGSRRQVEELQARLDRTLLTCEAIWTLVRDKFGLTEVDLLNRINELDMADGRLDGKVRRPGHKCPACERVIGPRFPNCMYCGQGVQFSPFA